MFNATFHFIWTHSIKIALLTRPWKITNGQYLSSKTFFRTDVWVEGVFDASAKNSSRLRLNSSWVLRKLIMQETPWRDERLSRHALTAAFLRMSHAELFHFSLEVQRRSERVLLRILCRKKHGREWFAKFAFTSWKYIWNQMIVPYYFRSNLVCVWKYGSLWASGEGTPLNTFENHSQKSPRFTHSHPETTCFLHVLSSIQVGTGCFSRIMNFATLPGRVQELTCCLYLLMINKK